MEDVKTIKIPHNKRLNGANEYSATKKMIDIGHV